MYNRFQVAMTVSVFSLRQNESGQQAWEPGGVGEKATYRHTGNPLI